MFDHAQNIFWVGYVAWQRGETDQALIQFRAYKQLADRLVTRPGIKQEWRLEPIYADTNLGALLIEQEKFTEAGSIFQAGLPAVEALLDPWPTGEAQARFLARFEALTGGRAI